MAQVVLHLLVLKLNNRDLRYVILGSAEGLTSPTPLFLGADLLDGSGVLASNHCRIHSRYAKKGLASKLIFPAEVCVGGIPNIHSGTWFYSLQGVLQIIFEFHDHHFQVAVVTRLVELWKQHHEDPPLPDSIQVALQPLRKQLTSEQGSDNNTLQLVNPGDSGIASPSDDVNDILEEPVSMGSTDLIEDLLQESQNQLASSCRKSGEDNFAEGSEKLKQENQQGNFPDVDSLKWFLKDGITRSQVFLQKCQDEDRPVVHSVIAFLRMLYSETDSCGGNETWFTSFLDIIIDYSRLLHDGEKLKVFCSAWDISEKNNALLCLVSEWLGKKLFGFGESIARHVEDFKTRNINCIQDLPPPQLLIDELFPECMRLLVGHWIGLYGSLSSLAATSSPLQHHEDSAQTETEDLSQILQQPGTRKGKSGGTAQSRDDHSYSTPLDSSSQPTREENSSVQPATKKLKTNISFLNSDTVTLSSDDHNYYSTTTQQNTLEINLVPPREDHTYVANPSLEMDEIIGTGNSRDDHTYVVTHNRKNRTCSVMAPKEDPENTTCSNVNKHSRYSVAALCGRAETNVVTDPSKYPFIQLILEFMNSALISGVAHVVYSRLLHT